MAEDLVKVLLESNQEVPDFLADKKPEDGEELKFNDCSDDDDDNAAEEGDGAAAWGNGGGDAWGGGEDDAAAAAAVVAPAGEWNDEASQAW